MITHNGWTYYTTITPMVLPTEQKLQKLYLKNYNEAYRRFIDSLCINEHTLKEHYNSINIKTNKLFNNYILIINCDYNNDIIKIDDYSVFFSKSKFINLRQFVIKKDLIKYYNFLNLYVKGPYKLFDNNDNYYLEIKKLN